MVLLHALGQCVIRTAIGTIGPRAELGFALATRLIADRGRKLTRRYLATLFWPDAEEQKAAHSLSEALHRLRARGIPVESNASQAVWIARDAAALDVDRIPELAPSELVRCDFTILPGFDPHGSPALMDWADEFRHHLRMQTVRNTGAVIRRAEHEGDWTNALTLAEHVLHLDPDDADALAARARAAEALRAGHHAEAKMPATRSAFGHRRDGAAAVREPSREICALPSPPSPPTQGSFVGRDDELRILRDLWDRTTRGRGRRAAVHGPSGIGKTRLIRHFATTARKTGGVIAETSCDIGDVERPLSALMRLVPRLRALPGAAGASPELRPYLDRLTEYDTGATQWPDASDVAFVLSCIERAIDELVEAISDEQPLVIVVDNAQWVDRESARFLDTLSLGASRRPVMVITVSCDPPSAASSAECGSAVPIAVGPLPDASARALVLDRARELGRSPDDALVEWLVRAGEGSPLQLEELVAHSSTGGCPFELPPTFTALLKSRIAALPAAELRVLRIVALLKHQAHLDRVERIASLEAAAFAGAVESLGRSGFLLVDGTPTIGDATGRMTVLTCRHAAVGDVAIGELSGPAQAVLHREIAADLDANPSRSADALWDSVSHWSAGNEPVDVVRTTVSCARHLASIGLADAGATACRQILAQRLPRAARRQALAALAHSLHLGWKWAEVDSVAAELRQLDAGVDVHDDVELCVLDARWHLQMDPDETVRSAMRCASTAEAPAAHRVRAAEIVIKLATNTGSQSMLRAAFDAVESLLTEPDVDPGDRVCVPMMFHAVAGSLQLAEQYARALMRTSDQMPEPSRLKALINSASTLARVGCIPESLDLCNSVTRAAIRRGLTPIATAACNRGANICLEIGDVVGASDWAERFAAHAGPDDQCRRKAILLALARIGYHEGQLAAADAYLHADGAPLWEDALPAFQASTLATAIAVGKAANRGIDYVRLLLDRIQPLHQRLQGMGVHDFVAFAIACGYEYVGERDRATTLLASYLTHHRRESYPVPERFTAMVSCPVGV